MAGRRSCWRRQHMGHLRRGCRIGRAGWSRCSALTAVRRCACEVPGFASSPSAAAAAGIGVQCSPLNSRVVPRVVVWGYETIVQQGIDQNCSCLPVCYIWMAPESAGYELADLLRVVHGTDSGWEWWKCLYRFGLVWSGLQEEVGAKEDRIRHENGRPGQEQEQEQSERKTGRCNWYALAAQSATRLHFQCANERWGARDRTDAPSPLIPSF